MAISAQDVKQLKELTNCGMMDCKRALEETGGNIDEAIKYLREKGLAKAAKKAGRIAAEGLVYAKVDEAKKTGVILEINCETDFAAKSDRFVEFVEMVAQTVIDNDVSDVEALKNVNCSGTGEKIADVLVERISTISENIQIRRFSKLTGDGLFSYVHNGGGSIIGTLLKISADDYGDDVKACGKNLLLHITATSPDYITSDAIPEADINEERETQLNLIKSENEAKPKPQNVVERILEGRMKKFFEERCLLTQPYVKDPDMTVEKYAASIGKNIKVVDFIRFEKGEGIAKKAENFADEVASMAGV
ncbi:MAG: translation elongation factor Ts [Oscillospiraceae bacterium]|jgi:elongation factor Ts|nr:translation elongation factor Ts [Oscillospiraceae bacterium]